MSGSLPSVFIDQLAQLFSPAEGEELIKALEAPAPVSIQLHPSKSFDHNWTERINWHESGRYLPSRPVFTLDPAFQAGAYYVQEASSMFIAHLAKSLLPSDRPWRILDLCAAPGGKSCLLAAVAPPGSLLISNEIIKNRYQTLRYNLKKWGMDNCWVTNLDPEKFNELSGFFDLVLVDAPCSGEGMFRKDPAARDEWSKELVDLCAGRQKRILRAAAPLLRKGGLLLYSTCTFNEQENDEQARFVANELGMTIEAPSIPQGWDIKTSPNGYHFYPHRIKGEGFFALAARKNTDDSPKKYRSRKFPHWTPLPAKQIAIPASYLEDPDRYDFFLDGNQLIYALNKEYRQVAEIAASALGRIDLGFPVGTIKGKQLVPAPELALHTARKKSLPAYEVDRITALRLLKKETPPLPDLERGWQLITYQGLGLMWLKGLGNRYNNYYPSAWRIRMEVK